MKLSHCIYFINYPSQVIDKKITTTDTGIHFKKLKLVKVSILDYQKFLEDLAKTRSVDLAEIKKKMAGCGTPGSNVLKVQTQIFKIQIYQKKTFFQAGAKAEATVSRLTDPSKYTGSSKQRFDDTGKGKGKAGREDQPDGSGYVAGYKHKDTFDKTH